MSQRATVQSITYNNAKIEEDFGTGLLLDSPSTVPFSFENHFWKYTPSSVLAHVESCLGSTVGQLSGRVSKRNDALFLGVLAVLLLCCSAFGFGECTCVCICVHKHTSL